ncbi:MAG: hypothetical protein EGQ64_05565, partial [Ruminococcaceae bacterium]|nr:hypothetical protein [Oscillospiraceae bacterium]
DATMQEPTLLPTTFPNVLVSANTGIAVGMASNICSFNLAEVCQTTIAYLKDPNCDLLQTLPAPDFPTGAEVLYDPQEMARIYETGRGSVKLRARYRYVKADNLIEIYEIPYTTTCEAIIDKVSELIKAGKIRAAAPAIIKIKIAPLSGCGPPKQTSAAPAAGRAKSAAGLPGRPSAAAAFSAA